MGRGAPLPIKRYTFTLDEEIHDEAARLADELNLSLSAMTRLLYVVALAGERLVKELRDHLKIIEELYPDGEVPPEDMPRVLGGFALQAVGVINRWQVYVDGLLKGANIPGLEPGQAKPLTLAEVADGFAKIAEDAPVMQWISQVLSNPGEILKMQAFQGVTHDAA